MNKALKYAGSVIHYLGPTITLAVIALLGFSVLSARLESQQKKLYVAMQNQVAQFRGLADGIAQAKVRVVEKKTIRHTVKELPPEIRAELKRLNAKVEALLKANITVPAITGAGNAAHEEPFSWTFTEPDVLDLSFKLKAAPTPQNAAMFRNLDGAFTYNIHPVPLELTMAKGVYSHNGVDGLQQWYITATDKRTGDPLAVKSFDVRIPNMFKKKHWYKKWYFVLPSCVVMGIFIR